MISGGITTIQHDVSPQDIGVPFWSTQKGRQATNLPIDLSQISITRSACPEAFCPDFGTLLLILSHSQVWAVYLFLCRFDPSQVTIQQQWF